MRLDKITKEGHFHVIGLNYENRCISRLASLGLLPGERVRLLHEAPLGDPIAVEFRNCRMSLRLSDAADIEVEPARAQ